MPRRRCTHPNPKIFLRNERLAYSRTYGKLSSCERSYDSVKTSYSETMRQHVPLAIRKGTDRCNGRCQPQQKCRTKPESNSAKGSHLLSNVECGYSYNEDCFRILSKAKSDHLLMTTLPIWYYLGHMIKVRTMKCQNLIAYLI